MRAKTTFETIHEQWQYQRDVNRLIAQNVLRVLAANNGAVHIRYTASGSFYVDVSPTGRPIVEEIEDAEEIEDFDE